MGMTDTPELRRLLVQTGQAGPDEMASPDDVVAFALANLENGPVQNWGLAEDDQGHLPQSAADRRQRVRALDELTQCIFKPD
jgi:hypothetical protein